MGTITKPDIIRQTIIINDDYVRKNRRVDGVIALRMGYADIENKRIFINNFVVDKNVKLLSQSNIADLNRRINSVDEGDIIAHESQHIHNGAIGYHYLANSDNIYECMMLGLADEMSAMIAGYFHKYKNIDAAMAETIKNLSGDVRSKYIAGQFSNHCIRLQQVHGKNKNLYEHKFDSNKINKLLKYYFTVDGVCLMDVMSKQAKMQFSAFIVDIKSDIKKHIEKQIIMSKNNQKDI
jgi:hypothetical protein